MTSARPIATLLALLLVLLVLPSPAPAAEAALFRLFLLNGESLTSYGEFTRVDDRVIFSMPVGGSVAEPRLHVVSLPAGMIDWSRTGRHVASARAQRYAETRGEEDFRVLTGEVARVLGQIALTTDRSRALAIAEQARQTLSDWPRTHFGYRQDEVRDVIGVLDSAITQLRGSGGGFELALVATVEPIPAEPVAGIPPLGEQLAQIFRVIAMTAPAADRMALLQSAAALLDEARVIPGVDVKAVRRKIGLEIQQELDVDARYARLTREISSAARKAAGDGDITRVQKILASIRTRNADLGLRRPEVVLSLEAALLTQVDAARQLRLLRDRWQLRKGLYSDYQRRVGSQINQLGRVQSELEAIRELEGPPARALQNLRRELSGGADRLTRMAVPTDLKLAHDLLVSAWRFAESAARIRHDAVMSGSLPTARQASSSAAGALLMLARAQQEIRSYLEPPRLP
jgi:hypothetical protein